MSLIKWNDRFSVDITEIDQQHQKLISLINQLYDAMREGKAREVLGPVLADLVKYTQYHFATEEELFRKYAYPDAEAHIELHTVLTAKARELHENLGRGNDKMNIEVMLFLSNWLNVHILEVDMKYAEYLNKNKR